MMCRPWPAVPSGLQCLHFRCYIIKTFNHLKRFALNCRLGITCQCFLKSKINKYATDVYMHFFFWFVSLSLQHTQLCWGFGGWRWLGGVVELSHFVFMAHMCSNMKADSKEENTRTSSGIAAYVSASSWPLLFMAERAKKKCRISSLIFMIAFALCKMSRWCMCSCLYWKPGASFASTDIPW